ncbi:MAG: cytochrome c [Methanosarcinaceae archaeon]|nr:cytochrome c [Methanosarcinaceae archaeon]
MEVMVNKTPAGFFEIVTNGIPNTQMPSWSGRLSEDECWNVVERVWIFQFSDYPPSPYIIENPTETELRSLPETSESTESSASAPESQTPLGTGMLIITVMMAYLVVRIRES